MKDFDVFPVSGEIVEINGFATKPGTSEDVPAMVLIEDQAIAAREGQPLPSEPLAPQEVERLRDEIQKPESWSRVAYFGDTMAGFVFGRPGKDPDTNSGVPGREHISLLMIHPDFWGKGLAGGLLDWSFGEAQQRGAKEISLWTETDNKRSRALYERKGFLHTGKTRVDPDPLNPHPQVHYLKQL